MAQGRINDQLLSKAASLSAATLYEASGRIGAMPASIKPLDANMRMCGRALPVHCPPGDNLWIHRALAVAEPNDVLVVDTAGANEFGYWGEIMATAAIARRLSGVVIIGGVRDSNSLMELGLPTFSTCVSVKGTSKDPHGDGAVLLPVSIGSIHVNWGDLIVGDADGVVAIPSVIAEWAIYEGLERVEKEAEILGQVRAGALTVDVLRL